MQQYTWKTWNIIQRTEKNVSQFLNDKETTADQNE